jgi:hypothetical protein
MKGPRTRVPVEIRSLEDSASCEGQGVLPTGNCEPPIAPISSIGRFRLGGIYALEILQSTKIFWNAI